MGTVRLLEVRRWVVVGRVGRCVHMVKWRILCLRRRSVGVIALRRVGKHARGAIATCWEVPTGDETGDFGGRKVVHASRRVAFAHCLWGWGWRVERASIGDGRERRVDSRIVGVSLWWRWRVVCLLGIVVAIVRIGWLSGWNTVR